MVWGLLGTLSLCMCACARVCPSVRVCMRVCVRVFTPGLVLCCEMVALPGLKGRLEICSCVRCTSCLSLCITVGHYDCTVK